MDTLCEKCHSRPACVHIRVIDQDHSAHVMNLCASCAMETLAANGKGGMFFSAPPELVAAVGANLAKFLEEGGLHLPDLIEKLQSANEPEPPHCPTCGATMRQIQDGLRIGCRDCLTFFRNDLRNLLGPQLAEQRRHRQESTAVDFATPEQEQLLVQRQELLDRLEQAVKTEAYENAQEVKLALEALDARRRRILAASPAPQDPEAAPPPDAADGYRRLRRLLQVPVWAPRQATPAAEKPDIVLSSFVHLDRNFADLPLKLDLTADRVRETAPLKDALVDALLQEPLFHSTTHGDVMDLETLTTWEHLAAADAIDRTAGDLSPHRLVLGNQDASAFAQIFAGPAHLRLSLWAAPDQLFASCRHLQAVAQRLARKFAFANDAEFGAAHLDLTMLGSGLRLGLILHLPLLVRENDNSLDALQTFAAQHRLRIQAAEEFDDNPPTGLFQLTTDFGLGDTLNQRCRALLRAATILERRELEARAFFQNHIGLQTSLLDEIGRAAGTLLGAARLAVPEQCHVLSAIWLGAELGIFPDIHHGQIYHAWTSRIFPPPPNAVPPDKDAFEDLEIQAYNATQTRSGFFAAVPQ